MAYQAPGLLVGFQTEAGNGPIFSIVESPESMVKFWVGQECGQKWYRRSSWKVLPPVRRLPFTKGFAIGPIMFFFEENRYYN